MTNTNIGIAKKNINKKFKTKRVRFLNFLKNSLIPFFYILIMFYNLFKNFITNHF